jgi:hypothetical protein
LREISKLNPTELSQKIFTINKRLSGKDLTKMNIKEDKEDDMMNDMYNLVKNLKCMKGVDAEFVPSYKFF